MQIISDNIINVGVEDRKTDLFEGMYVVPDGITYNSYVLKSDKIAVIDSVDKNFADEWLKNIRSALGGVAPDYLVIQHMEPDHSGSVVEFLKVYPDVTIVGNRKTFVMLGEYFGDVFKNKLVVNDGDELSLGNFTLKFIFAPMVHWPEVMFSYETSSRILFSADAFGKFGIGEDDGWNDEARRYYIGIVGKYGVQVSAVLKKVSVYPIEKLAPLHGGVLQGEALENALSLYAKWAGYEAEENGVFIAYASVYGHTEEAAMMLKHELEGFDTKCEIADLARSDWAECVAKAFRYSKLVLASTTYNADIFPAVREYIARLVERNYQKRTVAFIENGTWAPVAAKLMKSKLEGCKELTFSENTVRIHSALNDESGGQIKALAAELSE